MSLLTLKRITFDLNLLGIAAICLGAGGMVAYRTLFWLYVSLGGVACSLVAIATFAVFVTPKMRALRRQQEQALAVAIRTFEESCGKQFDADYLDAPLFQHGGRGNLTQDAWNAVFRRSVELTEFLVRCFDGKTVKANPVAEERIKSLVGRLIAEVAYGEIEVAFARDCITDPSAILAMVTLALNRPINTEQSDRLLALFRALKSERA